MTAVPPVRPGWLAQADNGDATRLTARMRTLVSVSSDAKRPLRRLYVAEAVSGAGDGVFWVGLITALASGTSVGALLTLAVVARLGPRWR